MAWKNTIFGLMLSFSAFADFTSNENFILADKQRGKLYVYTEDDRKIYETNALFGKEKGDILEGRSKITPSGEYVGVKMYSEHLGENIVAFLKVTNEFVIAIHPVWTKSKVEKRLERLSSISPEDNRISNGCINIPREFFYDIVDKIPNGTKVIILKENEVFNKEAFERTIPLREELIHLSGE